MTTDGYAPYLDAVAETFGPDIDYAQLIKIYHARWLALELSRRRDNLSFATTLGERAPVSAPDGLSFSQGWVPELVPQAHGGALMRGGTPEMSSKGGLAAAEKRRARAERDEGIDDAVSGHIEKLSEIVGQLVEDAGGEQYRCTCGVLGPKVPKLALREAADVLRLLMAAVKKPGDQATVVPIQVIVNSLGPLVAGVVPDNGPRNPTTGQNP